MNQEKQSLSSASIIGFAVVLFLFAFVLFANLDNRTIEEVATPQPVGEVAEVPAVTPTPEPLVGYFESDVNAGRTSFMGTCSACHGADARGVTGLGPDLVNNAFTFGLTDQEFHDFVVRGRSAFDPDNKTRVEMPPRGGNPGLTDQALDNIIAYLRVQGDPSLLLSDDLRPETSDVTEPEATQETVVEATVEPTVVPTIIPTEEAPDTVESTISTEGLHLYASDNPWVAPLIDYNPYDALLSEQETYERIVEAFTLLYPNGIPEGVLPDAPVASIEASETTSEEGTTTSTGFNPYASLPDTSNITAPVNPFASGGDSDDSE
jgi:mono/diheme cytochrome c family protein